MNSYQVKTLLADGIHVAGYGQLCASTSYESNVPFVLRFMVRFFKAHQYETNRFSYREIRQPELVCSVLPISDVTNANSE